MLSAVISARRGYSALQLALQLTHQRSVHPGPLVLGAALLSEGIRFINDGFSMVICPEGTRSKGPKMGPFMKGAVKLATKPGVPIVPISINGTYHMFEETGVARGARIDVIVHEPIETAAISRREERGLSDKVEQIIRNGVDELAKTTGTF